jgi:hypothetical protein
MRPDRLPLMEDKDPDEVAPYARVPNDPDEVRAFIDWALDDDDA